MNNSKGFTLIELVIVIVILGILAATAAPKFIDLTGDARAAVVKGVEGSVNSAADIAHAKALIEGQTAETGTITVGTTDIALAWGWPTNASIETMVEISDEDILFAASSETEASTWTHQGATDTDFCYASYDNQVTDAETRPTVTSVVEDTSGSDPVTGC